MQVDKPEAHYECLISCAVSGQLACAARLTLVLQPLRERPLDAAMPLQHRTPSIPHRRAAIPPYQKILKKFEVVRSILGPRKLSLAEKILYAHLDNVEESLLTSTNDGKDIRGNANLKLKPDRVAMQDASAQMALLQFMTCNLPSTAVPASIHCDHMIVGEKGADTDLPNSIAGNKEVFDFLESAAKKYGD